MKEDDPYLDCPRVPLEGMIDPGELFLLKTPAEGSLSALESPVELEIGPGRGWFSVERVEMVPDTRIIGLEIRRKWATIVDERLKKRGLADRGRVFAEDAREVLPRFRENSLQRVYIHFPDPWWKKRHAKRLVVTTELLDTLTRLLVPGGELFIQTDVFERAEQYQAVVDGHDAFQPIEGGPRVDDHPFVARSPRERKAIDYELPVVRLRYFNQK